MMDISGIDCLGLAHVLKRGTGEIIAQTDDALLVRDAVSGAYFLGCGEAEIGLPLLDRFVGSDCALLTTTNYRVGMAAFERYGFSDKLECRQVAFFGDAPPLTGGLSVRAAEENDLPMLEKAYRLVSPEELGRIVSRGNLLIGYRQNDPVGFIGEHLEGSMGLLYVFPEYRRRGYGEALERHFIARTKRRGYIPFGQVEKDNLESLRLQRRIGMTVSGNLIVWMWK